MHLGARLLSIIQRGNNRQPAFFAEEDYHRYLDCLREAAKGDDCEIHAYVIELITLWAERTQ